MFQIILPRLFLFSLAATSIVGSATAATLSITPGTNPILPEPSVAFLFGVAGLILLFRRRNRSR